MGGLFLDGYRIITNQKSCEIKRMGLGQRRCELLSPCQDNIATEVISSSPMDMSQTDICM
jgi:hypothetical protein